ncbi:ribose-phosphate diphosphokinase [Geoalkalibacter halelectricus]|uniref:Ribose-phosphate pyrophosphokinase n=1 Tax=Geoalkalibacter halelectricus TaxID=2847045 RepID=A0ABY5ZKH8_9BACT|nr:ribose-phosphate pyrophosphokinase [Geoalkalibacter halelectricus]MDO3380183.1 ribose-phosphate pyrophosphokinase [Geoalkalibacter halelectricus]UWZ78244.1 ribose-phosphate pyrophosphokinase [Geoalkalibacter halelectricus]
MNPVLVLGRSHPNLGRKLAAALGIAPAHCLIEDFADEEIRVAVKETVTGAEVFVLQSTAAPADRHLLEMLLLADACRRRGARRVTAILPYFGYARQDRRVSGEEPIGARLITDLLATRFDRIIAVDLHNAAIEGFSGIPLTHLTAVPLLAEAFREYRRPDQVLVAPDAGAVKLAQRYGELLRLPVAYIEKVRKSDQEVEVQAITGEVKDRAPVLVDDMISTGGTLIAAMEALRKAGAEPEFSILAAHALLVGQAPARLERFSIQRIITTDSVARKGAEASCIRRYTLAQLLADALRELTRPGRGFRALGGGTTL